MANAWIKPVGVCDIIIINMNSSKLVDSLRSLATEVSWVEFKHNNFDPAMIGADISALANAAALADRNNAYMLWGIQNETHEVVGCDKNLQNLKVGGEEIEE